MSVAKRFFHPSIEFLRLDPALVPNCHQKVGGTKNANPKGIFYERWVHTHGCKKWFNAVRNTSTDEILKIYKLGEESPPLKDFKNTPKTPSGEPKVGSGNFAVKKL